MDRRRFLRSLGIASAGVVALSGRAAAHHKPWHANGGPKSDEPTPEPTPEPTDEALLTEAGVALTTEAGDPIAV